MKKLLLLAVLAISLMSCESQSGRRARMEAYPALPVMTTYSVHVDAYLNDSIIASKDYVVRNTKTYTDSIIAVKVGSLVGVVACDSIRINTIKAELVK